MVNLNNNSEKNYGSREEFFIDLFEELTKNGIVQKTKQNGNIFDRKVSIS